MPFVICPVCPKAVEVDEEDIATFQEVHSSNHAKRKLAIPKYEVFMTDEDVSETWIGHCARAIENGVWKSSVERD